MATTTFHQTSFNRNSNLSKFNDQKTIGFGSKLNKFFEKVMEARQKTAQMHIRKHLAGLDKKTLESLGLAEDEIKNLKSGYMTGE